MIEVGRCGKRRRPFHPNTKQPPPTRVYNSCIYVFVGFESRLRRLRGCSTAEVALPVQHQTRRGYDWWWDWWRDATWLYGRRVKAGSLFFFFFSPSRPFARGSELGTRGAGGWTQPDWQTSDGPLFFDSFPERLERNRHAGSADAYFQNGPGHRAAKKKTRKLKKNLKNTNIRSLSWKRWDG